jgi:hypothetical protein
VHERQHPDAPASERERPARESPTVARTPAQLALRLQQTAGNAATVRALQRFVNPQARKDDRPDEYGKMIHTDHTGHRRARIEGSLYVYDASKGQDTSGVDVTDVEQGNLGDCWFLSAVMAVAKTNPQAIKRLIKPLSEKRDGSNVYEITLYERHTIGSPTAHTVKVDDTFVEEAGGTSTYAHPQQRSAAGPELWVLLLEKAWAAINGGYSKIHFGDSRAGMVAVTGHDVDTMTPSAHSAKALAEELRERYNAKKPMTISTFAKFDDKQLADMKSFVKHEVVPSHAYAITRVDPELAQVDIRNPWGGETHLLNFPISWLEFWFRQIVMSEDPV